jgi:hypothetical protein
MAHRLNTNKQFMIGNGLLAFAVIIVVVLFVYLSLREGAKKDGTRTYTEVYELTLERGFAGDSLSLLINDSLIWQQRVSDEPITVSVNRFAEESTLFIVDNRTEKMSLFNLSERGGNYRFEKEDEEVKLLSQQ